MAHTARLTLIVAITAALYGAGLVSPFIYEDAHWMSAGRLEWEIPSRALSSFTYAAVPLTPVAQHGVNLGLHLLNGLLLYGVVSVVMPAAALWAMSVLLLHPLAVSSVSYAAARPDLLLTTGVLLACWSALGTRWYRWLGMGAGVVVAALSKEMGVIAVPLVALTAAVWRRDSPVLVAALTATVMVIGAGLGMAFPTLAHWWTLPAEAGGAAVPWVAWLSLQNAALWHLLALVVWPIGFSMDHDALAFGARVQVVSVCLSAAALFLGMACWHRGRLIAWSLGLIVLAVLPRFVFRTSEFITEAQMYLPMVGTSAMAGAGLAWAWAPRRLIARTV